MKKILIPLALLVVVVAVAFGVGYTTNRPPVAPAIVVSDPAVATRPYIVKIHARWCPVCMLTKPVWAELERAYRGRANFVVFDVTDAAARAASRAEARRLGLDSVYEQYAGATGTIVIADAARKLPREAINGSRNPADYIAAVEAVFRAAAPLPPVNPRPAPASDTFVIP